MRRQARRNTPPKQIRYPTGCSFAFDCSPPRIAATQLSLATQVVTSYRLDLHQPDNATSRTHLHHVRDVSMNEDRCRVRAGARPLAALRNLTLSIIRKLGRQVPAARENFREDRSEAIKAVTGRIL